MFSVLKQVHLPSQILAHAQYQASFFLFLLTNIGMPLRQYCHSCLFVLQSVILTKSLDDPSTYLINDIEDPLQRSLATLDLPDVFMIHPAHLSKLPSSSQGEKMHLKIQTQR